MLLEYVSGRAGRIVTTLFIIDDRAPIRQALTERLSRVPGVYVVGSASRCREAMAQIRAIHPDVVLLEPKIADCQGMDTLRAIRAELPDTRVILLTSYLDDFERQVALKAGAQAYLLKDIDSSQLAGVILGSPNAAG